MELLEKGATQLTDSETGTVPEDRATPATGFGAPRHGTDGRWVEGAATTGTESSCVSLDMVRRAERSFTIRQCDRHSQTRLIRNRV